MMSDKPRNYYAELGAKIEAERKAREEARAKEVPAMLDRLKQLYDCPCVAILCISNQEWMETGSNVMFGHYAWNSDCLDGDQMQKFIAEAEAYLQVAYWRNGGEIA